MQKDIVFFIIFKFESRNLSFVWYQMLFFVSNDHGRDSRYRDSRTTCELGDSYKYR